MEPREVILRCGIVGKILWDCDVGHRPLIGAYESKRGWEPLSWRKDGRYLDPELDCNLDIIEYGKTETKPRKACVQKQLGEAGS